MIKNQLRGNITWVSGPSLQLVLKVNKIIRKAGFVNSLWIRLIKDTFTVGPLVVQWLRIACQGRGHRFYLVQEDPTRWGAPKRRSRHEWARLQSPSSALKGGLQCGAHTPQLERSCFSQQQTSSTAKNKQINTKEGNVHELKTASKISVTH